MKLLICLFLTLLFSSFGFSQTTIGDQFVRHTTENNLYTKFLDFTTGRAQDLDKDYLSAHVYTLDEEKLATFFSEEGMGEKIKIAFEKYINFLDPHKIYFFYDEVESILSQEQVFWNEIARNFMIEDRLPLFKEWFLKARQRLLQINQLFPLQEWSSDLKTKLTYYEDKNDNQALMIDTLIDFSSSLKDELGFNDQEKQTWHQIFKQWPKDKVELRKKVKTHLAFSFLSEQKTFQSTDRQREDDVFLMNWVLTNFLRMTDVERLINLDKYNEDQYPFYVLNFLFKSVDTHSHFFSEQEYSDFLINHSGEISGLGVSISHSLLGVAVISVLEGAPSEHCLKPEDIILSTKECSDQEEETFSQFLSGFDLRDSLKYLRGISGTEVEITVFRKSTSEIFKCNIVRGTVKASNQFKDEKTVYQRKQKRLGIIKLSSFHNLVYDEFTEKLNKLNCKTESLPDCVPIEGLIVDLRSNLGGSLPLVAKIVNRLVEGYSATVYAVYSKGIMPEFFDGNQILDLSNAVAKKQIFSLPDILSRKTGYLTDLPMIVLINEHSASASEIFSGSLQTFNRVLVMGTSHSYGKGSVQRVNSLDRIEPNAKEGFKVTTGYFYLPDGHSNQYIGISSDLVLEENANEVQTERDVPLSPPVPKPLSKSEIEPYENSKWMTDTEKVEVIDALQEHYKTMQTQSESKQTSSDVDAEGDSPSAESELRSDLELSADLQSDWLVKEDGDDDLVKFKALELLGRFIELADEKNLGYKNKKERKKREKEKEKEDKVQIEAQQEQEKTQAQMESEEQAKTQVQALEQIIDKEKKDWDYDDYNDFVDRIITADLLNFKIRKDHVTSVEVDLVKQILKDVNRECGIQDKVNDKLKQFPSSRSTIHPVYFKSLIALIKRRVGLVEWNEGVKVNTYYSWVASNVQSDIVSEMYCALYYFNLPMTRVELDPNPNSNSLFNKDFVANIIKMSRYKWPSKQIIGVDEVSGDIHYRDVKSGAEILNRAL